MGAPQEKGGRGFFDSRRSFVGWRDQNAADTWKKDVWDFQVFSQTFFELRFSLENEGKDGKNLNSQTWPGTPRRPSPDIRDLPTGDWG